MSKQRVQVAEGLAVSVGDDGHWLEVTAPNGRYAAINLESMRGHIIWSAFVSWAESQLIAASANPGRKDMVR